MSVDPAVARLAEKNMAAANLTRPAAPFAPTSLTDADVAARIAREVASVRAALKDGEGTAAEVFESIRRNHPEDAQAVANALATNPQ